MKLTNLNYISQTAVGPTVRINKTVIGEPGKHERFFRGVAKPNPMNSC